MENLAGNVDVESAASALGAAGVATAAAVSRQQEDKQPLIEKPAPTELPVKIVFYIDKMCFCCAGLVVVQHVRLVLAAPPLLPILDLVSDLLMFAELTHTGYRYSPVVLLLILSLIHI